MRWVVWVLLIFASAVGLAMLMHFNHGNVAVFWPPYRADLSVNLTLLLLGVLFLLLHLVMLGLGKAIDLPGRVRAYQTRRDRNRAIAAMRDSVLAFFEGRFGRAERLAQQVRSQADLAGPAALIAARAAHRMRETERRDKWLSSAQAESNTNHAYLVTAAELALEEQDGTKAIDLLRNLHGRGARHIHTLRLSMRAHEQSEQWEQVLQVLRQLDKRDALHPTVVQGTRLRAIRGLFVRNGGDAAALKRVWNSITSSERDQPEVVELAASAFAQADEGEFAWRLIEQGLQKGVSRNLLAQYQALKAIPARERLLRAEKWRGRFGDDPALMMTLGELCIEESLWGKAEEFFKLAATAEYAGAAHYALAQLYERTGKPTESLDEYRTAARLSFAGDANERGRAASIVRIRSADSGK